MCRSRLYPLPPMKVEILVDMLNDIYQKEHKIAVSTTTIPRYKKRMNRVINDENINQLNFENQNKYKGEYNKITFVNKKINEDDTFCICHY